MLPGLEERAIGRRVAAASEYVANVIVPRRNQSVSPSPNQTLAPVFPLPASCQNQRDVVGLLVGSDPVIHRRGHDFADAL